MRKKSVLRNFVIIFTLIFATAIFSACSKKLTEKDVDYAGPLLDNVLAGIKDKDYNKFSKDFSDTMKKAMNQESFNTLVSTLDTKIGEYKERSFSGAANSKKDNRVFTTVLYNAKYSKETKDVQITISFSEDNGKKYVEGLFMKSPNLTK